MSWSFAAILLLLVPELGVPASGADAGALPHPPPILETRKTNIDAVCAGADPTGLIEAEKLVAAGGFASRQAAFTAESTSPDRADLARRACLLNGMGFAELRQRRPGSAVEWLSQGLKLSPLPDAVRQRLVHNLASAYVDLGELDKAEEAARHAVDLAGRLYGSEHPDTLVTQALLAATYYLRQDYARAEPIYRRIVHQAAKDGLPLPYQSAVAAGNLALIYLAERRFPQARSYFEQSLNGLQRSSLRSKDEIALAQSALALCSAATGRAREGRALVTQALASAEADLHPADPSYSVVLERAATAQFLLKDPDAGRQLFERSIGLLENLYGRRSPAVRSGLERYVQLLRQSKDKAGARQIEARLKSVQ